MYQLLNSVRIVDLTTIVAGPFATSLLGDLGADVIKIESPGGDAFRSAVPRRSPGMGAGFMNINRNKRSVRLDLKTPTGHQALLKIVATADVFVHNMRPNAIAKLKLSPETLRQDNPDLIYCTSIGYGSDGPYADRPAYDDVVQAETGWAHLLTDTQGHPRLAPTIVADKVAGLYLTQAVLAALFNRASGGGALTVEVPMFEALTSFTLAEHMSGRLFDPPLGDVGYNRLMTPHRRPHPTEDGYLVALPYTTGHWQAFFQLVDRTDLAEAGWVADPDERAARSDEMYEMLGEFLRHRTTAQWLVDLAAIDVPAAQVNTLDDLFEDEHLAEIGFFQAVQHPTEGSIISAKHPVRYSANSKTDLPAPGLGAETRSILEDVGMTQREIDDLIKMQEAPYAHREQP